MAAVANNEHQPHSEPEPPPLMRVEDILRQAAAQFRKLTPEQTTSALHSSVSRARVQVEQTRQACERGKADHKAKGSPKLEPPSARQAELERLTTPGTAKPNVPEQYSKQLRALDAAVREIREQLVQNPLWIAATHVERNLKLTKVEDLLAQDTELAKVKTAFTKAEADLVAAKRALENWGAKPGWLRGVQNFLLGSGEKVQADFDSAAKHLVDQHRSASRVETERRYHHEAVAAERNGAMHEQQAEARRLREQLEAPLRSALLERSMAQDILIRGIDLRPLREAPANETLEFVGIRNDRGFPTLEFSSPTTLYRADHTTLAATHALGSLVPGDKYHFGLTPEGSRALELIETGPNLSPDRGVLEGTVGATYRSTDKLLRFVLTDEAGISRWVVPTRGDDLKKELGGDLEALLISGNQVRIQDHQVHLLGRERSAGVKR